MRRTIVLLSASLLVLTACTTTKGGTASPSTDSPGPSSSSSPAEGVPGPGVPKVEDPIDIVRFRQAPCDALTQDQITELLGSGVTPKPQPDAPAGPSCDWHPSSVTTAGVLVIFTDADNLGLTSVYRANGNQYKFFMPLDAIDGYPLVAYGVEDERNSDGRCTAALGVSDTQVVDINITQSKENIGKKDPCAATHDVAAKVLSNLRAR